MPRLVLKAEAKEQVNTRLGRVRRSGVLLLSSREERGGVRSGRIWRGGWVVGSIKMIRCHYGGEWAGPSVRRFGDWDDGVVMEGG